MFSETFVSPEEAHREEAASPEHHAESFDLVKHKPSVESGSISRESLNTYERMVLHDRPFLCSIPQAAPEVQDNSTASDSEGQQDLVKVSDSGSQLLEGMRGNCLYSGTGWWLYVFCYGEQISQFHPLPPARGRPPFPPTPDPSVTNFQLGRFRNSNAKPRELGTGNEEAQKLLSSETDVSTNLQTRGESNFLVQKLGGGTQCDLTGEARQIEVQYHCNPTIGDRISMIKEVATCQYLMVIHTPRLCNEAAFLPPQVSKPNIIACREVIAKEEEEDWKKGKAAQAAYEIFKTEQEDAPPAEGQPRKLPVVGGIELGGQKLVGGSPERTIKASKLVRPPKMDPKQEKYIATLASSDGKQTTIMNEREIRKHDLTHSLEQIEDYILQTEEWAENVRPGQPWKLDVVATAQGTEYRGILIANDAEAEDDAKPTEEIEKKQEGSQEEYKQPEKKP